MVTVLIWGFGKKLDLFLNILLHNDSINILGIVSERKQCFSYFSGIPVLTETEIKDIEFDIILLTDKKIRNRCKDSRIKEKMIDENVFSIPGFNLERYLKIRKEKWCIVSEDCWGGLCYSYLQMPFTSPFINTDIPLEDYYVLLHNLAYYLKCELEIFEEESLNGYAKGKLGNQICINLFHYLNGTEGKEKWNERLKRINESSAFLIKKTILNDDDAYKFSELPLDNKIGFYYKDLKLKNIICLKGWEDSKIRGKYHWDFKNYVRETVLDTTGVLQFHILDVFSDNPKIRCRME